ncbi:MAG: extracellular solute-binding protein [Chloroflexi bacterium]|nr:extracellular solute-binding protein [Chloroflexota bacterium]
MGAELSRRGALLRMAGVATSGPLLLAACGMPAPAAPSATRTGKARTVELPAYVPVNGPQPDLPGSADGIDPGYVNYPKDSFQSVATQPLTGGEVTIMTWNVSAPMTPHDQNPAWQAIEKQLGGKINLTIVPFADYQTRLGAVVAGNDLPDVLYIPSGTALQSFADFLDAKCADLTPFLSGDAVRAFPNLANFRTSGWQITLFNNKISAVPSQYALFYWVMWAHKELFDAVSADWPKSADEFKRVLQGVTNPRQNVWGIVAEPAGGFETWNGMFPSMFGAPNQWRQEASGKLTRTFETDEYKQSVSYARDLYSSGLFSPNSNTNNNLQSKADFAGRQAAVDWNGLLVASKVYWDAAPTLDPPTMLRNVPPFAADGKSKPTYWLYSGASGMAVLKKAPAARIKEVLGVIDYLAAPFGSQEYTLLTYGLPTTHYTLDAHGNPIPTQQAQQDINNLWTQGWAPPPVLYYPKNPQYVPTVQGDERSMLASGIADPTVPLYSPTNGSKGGPLSQTFQDGLTDIVAGRRPFSDYDQLVGDWRSAGGDQIRAEYEQALQQTG